MRQPSFIPPRDIRELRDLTRRRRTLLLNGGEERNRIQKILEDANVKVGNVLSDVFGVSGQAILEALLENKLRPEEMAEFAKCRARAKIPQLIEAIEQHRMSEHHRFLIRQALRHMQFIENMISDLDKEIREKLKPYQKQLQLACTIPGIGPVAAASILAEIGMDMSDDGPFATCHHLASWAGICPGNNSSGGKRKNTRIRKGNRWLKATLCQTAWRNCRLQILFDTLSLMRLILELSPEREASLKAQAEARGLTVEQWLLQLAEQSGPSPLQSAESRRDARPVWEVITDNMKDVPVEDLAALPKDGASQIDHYVYGLPKRDQ